MSEPITPAVSDRICKHMNKDHADAVLFYAQQYGNCSQAESATMVAIDLQGMDLNAIANGETLPVRVNFDRELQDAKEAHHKLVEMLNN
ncbi:DUF2470 domain-containing protein [Oscillatoria sp. FACHB-1406]|uniref:DUF2470 domain-containing protein n=1 Tax=Oscillatoria sp. FACHB-1406 TaxID=2692846 RepID=UPI0016876EE3|nr:DUF2470 domain-containing protein [Oscillatoria sp. FACHB-1406]MBD2576121.1 DUF2470 domain-containing protein [Oscillatoria sp. FACHB-1406]